jgi:hypothetical protein
MLGWRLAVSLALSTIGGVGLWSVVVTLPVIEAEFGVGRGGASLPYTATMVGFAMGSVLMGRLADRFGIMVPVMLSALMLGIGDVAVAEDREHACEQRRLFAIEHRLLGTEPPHQGLRHRQSDRLHGSASPLDLLRRTNIARGV